MMWGPQLSHTCGVTTYADQAAACSMAYWPTEQFLWLSMIQERFTNQLLIGGLYLVVTITYDYNHSFVYWYAFILLIKHVYHATNESKMTNDQPSSIFDFPWFISFSTIRWFSLTHHIINPTYLPCKWRLLNLESTLWTFLTLLKLLILIINP